MQQIGFIICNSGDGSNHLEWFYPVPTEEQLQEIEESDYETYGSGDGIQLIKLDFPDEFSVLGWTAINGITLRSFEDWKADKDF